MKKRIAILIFSLLTSVAAVMAQESARILESLSMTSTLLGQDVKYSVILPEDYYTTKKSYPVVYLLHGLGDTESSWLEYGRVNQTVDALVRSGEVVPMIYVMPQGFRTYYVNDYAGKFPYQNMFIKELVPHIDKQYRTVADNKHRATMGYSMGGFGALILPLKNLDVFTVSVPLSISVRTDEQYKTEDASGWDDQWGRLFGAVGKTGEERLTDYYKEHSPFHLFSKDISAYKNLKLYIDNGDDEQTLCRSNEELHMLLRDKQFPHEFRVRNGGHEFSYWREALPNGLRFISDVFQGKPYRGDKKNLLKTANDSALPKVALTDEKEYQISLPREYQKTTRYYPVLYVLGKFNEAEKGKIAARIQSNMEGGLYPPVLVVFSNEEIGKVIAAVEKKYRARIGFRFRALIGFKEAGVQALTYALTPEQVTACVLFDTPVNYEPLAKTLDEKGKSIFSRTWPYLITTDGSEYYQANGLAHILLRDKDVYHEYRVTEGVANVEWLLANLPDVLEFTQRKIHR